MIKVRKDLTIAALAAFSLCAGTMAAAHEGGAETAGKPDQPRHAEHAKMSPDKLTNQTFVTMAAQSNLAEVALSQLALKQAENEDVRNFAQRMVQDHQKASAELKTLAQKQGLQVPQQLDQKHQAKMTKLQGMSGAEFDAAYSKAMAKDHDKAVMLFQNAGKAAQLNPELKAFAAKTLPTLETHHRLAGNLPMNKETRAAQAGTEGTNR